MIKGIFWAFVAAAVLATAWLLMTPLSSPSIGPTQEQAAAIQVNAANPWLIGDVEDAFSYAGEYATHIEGEAHLSMDPTAETGVLEFVLQPSASLTARLQLSDEFARHPVTLRLRLQDADAFWTDLEINKGRDMGDARLPVTRAMFASLGRVELILDRQEHATSWMGFWFVGDALRQDDGSIRNQGLVFSPLLRDPSIFSDPARKELTLLMYESTDLDVVTLHLVFPNVQLSGI